MNKLIKKAFSCASALTLVLATGMASAAALSGFIYTANERDASISEIALASGQVRTFKVPVVPHNIQITPDGAYLLAVGMAAGEHGKAGMQGMQNMPPDNDEGQMLVYAVGNL